MARKSTPSSPSSAPQSAKPIIRRTALYDYHASRAARMVVGGGGFMFPTSYTSPIEEHLNVRSNVGIQDLSSMGEVDIKGPGAERLLNRLAVNEIRICCWGKSNIAPCAVRMTDCR
ncbi:MAG: hypothetical protein R2865_05645 [Deinococcales bacterium]